MAESRHDVISITLFSYRNIEEGIGTCKTRCEGASS